MGEGWSSEGSLKEGGEVWRGAGGCVVGGRTAGYGVRRIERC